MLKIDSVENAILPTNNKKISLQSAISTSIGVSGLRLETITNVIIALTVEGIILFLCYSLSYVLRKSGTMNEKVVHDENNFLNQLEPIVQNENQLKTIRERLNLSQRQFAELAGIPRGTIARIETGRGELPDDVLEKISGYV